MDRRRETRAPASRARSRRRSNASAGIAGLSCNAVATKPGGSRFPAAQRILELQPDQPNDRRARRASAGALRVVELERDALAFVDQRRVTGHAAAIAHERRAIPAGRRSPSGVMSAASRLPARPRQTTVARPRPVERAVAPGRAPARARRRSHRRRARSPADAPGSARPRPRRQRERRRPGAAQNARNASASARARAPGVVAPLRGTTSRPRAPA